MRRMLVKHPEAIPIVQDLFRIYALHKYVGTHSDRIDQLQAAPPIGSESSTFN